MKTLFNIFAVILLFAACEKETIVKGTTEQQQEEQIKNYLVTVKYSRFERNFNVKINDTVSIYEGRENKSLPIVISCNNKTYNDTVKYTWYFTLKSDLTIKVIK